MTGSGAGELCGKNGLVGDGVRGEGAPKAGLGAWRVAGEGLWRGMLRDVVDALDDAGELAKGRLNEGEGSDPKEGGPR